MSTVTARVDPRQYDAATLLDTIVTWMIVVAWIVILFYAVTQMMPRAQYGVQFLGAMTLVYVLHEGVAALRERDWLDIALLSVLAAITITITVYVNWHFETLLYTRLGYALGHEYLLGGLFAIGIIYLTYRSYGTVFAAVIITAILYTHLGNHFPGLLHHSGFSAERIINTLVWEFAGMYGSINQIVATWVALFLLYAGLMRGYGAFDLILRVAFRLGSFVRSGVAQAAVTASLIIGSITGSQTANTAITGSFTIPLMKESGLRAETAGGIESVASSGGQIMPPVMGAAAFVMASILGVSYVTVLLAGLIPAAIFYLSVAVGVHYTAVKQLDADVEFNISDAVEEEKTQRELLVEGVRFLIPFFVLIYVLGIAQWTVMSAALYTCLLMFVTGLGFPIATTLVTDHSQLPETIVDVTKQTIAGFRYGAITLAPIAIIIAAINGVVDLLMVSGVPGKLSLALLGISGGVMAFAVILAMVVCIILGLGMPTVAAYIIVAFLIAPALIGEFGVPKIAAHYFVFYAAILSGLTPPIAIAVVVATGIAESNFWGTAVEALKISASLFVLPFAFVYNPEIVTNAMSVTGLVSGVIAFGGALSIIHGLNYFRQPMSNWVSNLGLRLVFFVAGVAAMVIPNEVIRTGVLLIAIVLFVVQRQYVARIDVAVDEPTLAED